MKMKKLTRKESGWIGTADKKYAVHATEDGITIAVRKALSTEYEEVTINDLDVLKEAVELYEQSISQSKSKAKSEDKE